MNDLIQRLRQQALPDPHDEREVIHAPLLREAASQLESKEARIGALTEALEPAWAALDRIDREPNDMRVRREAEIAAFYSVQHARKALSQE